LHKRLEAFLSRRENVLIVAVLFIALVLRLALIFSVTEPIDRDAMEYFDIAQNLVTGKGFSIDGIEPTARRAPGYPLFLAGLISVFGAAPRLLYISQAIINMLTIILVFLALKYVEIKSHWRLFVILLFSFSTSFVYVNVLYAEILTMFMVALILFLLLSPATYSRPILQTVMIGFAIGALIYLRPTYLYLPLFILVCAFMIRIFKRHCQVRKYLTMAGIAILMLAPWTIRNYVKFGQFIPLVAAGGGELWGANFEIAERTVWHPVSDIKKYEDQRTTNHALQNKLIAEYRAKYNLAKPEDLNRFLSKQGKEIILHHPFRYTLLSINRLMIFWFSPPIGSATLKAISPIIFLIILLLKYLLTIVSVFGLWKFTRGNFSGAFLVVSIILYLTILHSATHAIQRYFLPLIPLVYFGLGYFLDTRFFLKPRSSQSIRSVHRD